MYCRITSQANFFSFSFQYLRFLEDLSVALKMESINADMGVESILTSLMARVQQVVGKEGDLLVDRKTHIYNLQRKIKSLKEQLDSKELHMDLLRKKVRHFNHHSEYVDSLTVLLLATRWRRWKIELWVDRRWSARKTTSS